MNTLRRALTTTAALVVAVSGTLVAVQPASADTGFVHCHWAQLLTNGSFESPVVGSGWALTAGAGPVGWKTDDPGNWVELWNGTGMGVRPVQGAHPGEPALAVARRSGRLRQPRGRGERDRPHLPLAATGSAGGAPSSSVTPRWTWRRP